MSPSSSRSAWSHSGDPRGNVYEKLARRLQCAQIGGLLLQAVQGLHLVSVRSRTARHDVPSWAWPR